jgi:drug/metabolite transporter (DMT)-like permease
MTGILVAAISVICASPDATFLRCLQHVKVSNATILIWKMGLYAILQGGLAIHQDGSLLRVGRRVADAWPWMVVGSLAMCMEWMATVANLTTSSASALCLFYIAPLWAVPMGMAVNKDPLHCRTLVAMVVALAGISLIFAPNVLGPNSRLGPIPEAKPPLHHGAHHKPMHHHHHHKPKHSDASAHARAPHAAPSSLFGDLAGLASGLAFATWITTCRHAALHKPEAPLALCGSIGTLLVVIPTALLSLQRGDDVLDVTPRFIVLVLCDCAAVAAYNIGTMVASKYLPSAELGLYLTLDVVFAPLLVWAIHGEVPPYVVLEGGGLLLSALLAHEAIALMQGGGETFPGESLQLKTREVELSRLGADGGAGAEESAQPLMAAHAMTPGTDEKEEAESNAPPPATPS